MKKLKKVKRMLNMKMFFIFILLSIWGFIYSFNFFSPFLKIERVNVSEQNLEFTLSNAPIIINSENVYFDSVTFVKNKDYKLNYQTGKITFQKPLGNVFIEYQSYPANLPKKYFLYEKQEYSAEKKIKLPPRRNPLFSNTTKLQISGSKTIAVSVSRNEDFNLEQSLFLKMDGELSENLNIEAQLSDSQSPITPEGSSREISSLDKVFLRLYNRNAELAFGDLEMEFSHTEFFDYSPKFEGLKASWQRRNNYQAALAISKGKNTTIQFSGVEAKQGPYYLTNNAAELIQVVAGTEQVFLNGSLMQRGDDYVIDYSEGSITFDNKHFISANSLIQVNFQYSDENYRQNMYLAQAEVNFTDNLKMRNYLVFQNDDKDNPLQTEFTDSDINALKNGGDTEIWGSGVYEEEDGDYILHEDGYYQYVGNDSTIVGTYSIHFEYFGLNLGDYDLSDTEDYYTFAGTGQGEYLPIIKLTAPQKKTNYDLILEYETETFSSSAEAIYTQYDKNTYSSIDDNDNNGFAAKLSARYSPNLDLLKPVLTANYRQVGKDLHTFAELTDPLANYEAVQIPDSIANNSWNGTIKLNIRDFVLPEFNYANTHADDYAEQDYWKAAFVSRQLKLLPSLSYKYARLMREYDSGQNYNFDQNDLETKYKLKSWQLKFNYHFKETKQKYEIINSRILNENWQINLQTLKMKKISAELFFKKEFQETKIDTTDANLKDETIYTAGINSVLSLEKHSAKIQFSHREIYDNVKNDHQNFDLATVNLNNAFLKRAVTLSSSYAFKNVEFYPKIRELLYVGDNLGSYDEDSLYVGFGEGDYEWEIVEIDYDNPKMSLEVNANFTLNLAPSLITKSFLERFKSETNLQISENSKADDKQKIYLLDPDILMNEETTLYGRNLLRQTLWLDVIKKKLRAKVSYKQEDILDNRYNDISEKTNKLNWEGSLRCSAISQSVLEFIFERDEVEESKYNSFSKIDSYSLEIRNQLTSDVNLKSSLKYGNETGQDNNNANVYEIDSYQIVETLTYFLSSKYRLFGKLSWKQNKRSGSQLLSFLDDKKDGNIIKWNLNFDYKVNKITSAHLEYSGEVIPNEPTEHKISVEVKAEF